MEFMKHQSVDNVIAVGYSYGGAKATDFIAHCQKETTIKPEALLLLAPVGIQGQSAARLAATFALDTVGETIPSILIRGNIHNKPHNRSEKVRITLSTSRDVLKGVLKDVIRHKAIGYPGRLRQQVKEMTQFNEHLKDIAVPVILLQGKRDRPVGPQGNLKRGQMPNQDPDRLVEKELKTLFPNSPYAKRILGERDSKHLMTMFRAPQISRVAKILLDRYKRVKPEPIP